MDRKMNLTTTIKTVKDSFMAIDRILILCVITITTEKMSFFYFLHEISSGRETDDRHG